MTTLGERIRQARERKGLTVIELAELVGRHRGTVKNAETQGMSPPATDIPRYCKALGISADELLGIEDIDTWGDGYRSGYDLGWLDCREAIERAAKALQQRNPR